MQHFDFPLSFFPYQTNCLADRNNSFEIYRLFFLIAVFSDNLQMKKAGITPALTR